MGIDVTVFLANLDTMDNKAEKFLSDQQVDPSTYLNLFLKEKKLYVNSFRLRYVPEMAAFAEKLGLPEVWSDEDRLDTLFCSISLFEEYCDCSKEEDEEDEEPKKEEQNDEESKKEEQDDEDGEESTKEEQDEEDEESNTLEFPHLIEIGTIYSENTDYPFSFLHPTLIEELSSLFNHQTSIPMELLEKAYDEEYEAYTRPKKLRKQEHEEENGKIEEFKEWFRPSFRDDYCFFNNILLFYNTPEHVFSLLEKPSIEKNQVIVNMLNHQMSFEDFPEEYWFLIMEFIEDPFSLTRFGLAHSKLYSILCKNRVEWYQQFKRSIGLFTFLT